MQPPIEPKKEDCCDSGCNPCIFDVYEKQLQLYKIYIESGSLSNLGLKENAMSQIEYKQFIVLKSWNICSQHRLIFLKQSISEPDKHVFWKPGEHFLVKYQTDSFTCTRAYTPLKLEQLKDEYDFAIVIKQYSNGLVSNYLYNLNDGELTSWRGPYGNYELDTNNFSRLIMIAQGTGIAPFISIIKHILIDEENMTKIVLLFCCKSIDTIILRDELYAFKSYWNFDYKVYLSHNSDNPVLKYNEPISNRRLTSNDIFNYKPFTEKDQFLLCGCEEFMMQFSKILKEENSKANIRTF